MSEKKQGFVHGALILMLAGIVVKAVGAFFKIPLSNLIGDTAMGYFNTAYSVYSMCFLISTAGLPVAISRMIASSRAAGRTGEVEKIYRISLLLFLCIGLAGTAFLFFGADLLAAIPAEPQLGICLRAISPIMFFICLVACIRGYFQGHQNMIPTAVSQLIEVMGKLVLGLSGALLAAKKGLSPAAIAAWALGGITLGVVLSALFMTLSKALYDRKNKALSQGEKRRGTALAKELMGIAIPITVSSSILSLTSVIDSMLAVRRLNEAVVGTAYFPISSAVPVALTLCGAYMAKSVTLFNLTPTLIYPFAISIIPAISAARAKGDTVGTKSTVDYTFRITSAISLPAAFGLGILARPIIDLLFTENHPVFLRGDGVAVYSNAVAANMLSLLAAAIVFSGLVSVSGAVLQAGGFEQKSIFSTCFGVTAKAVSTYVLVGIPSIGLYGIPLSTLICYLVMFACNMFFLAKDMQYRPDFRKMLLKPALCALACGVCAMVAFWGLHPLLSPKLATVLSIAAGAAVYVLLLFRSRAVSEQDVLLLPKGERILKLLKKLHLIRA